MSALCSLPPSIALLTLLDHNEGVLTVTEPQVWTLIGVFAAALVGILTLMSTLFLRVIRSEIGGLRGEMTARLEAIDKRFDYLDRDVQALTKHMFGEKS